MPTDSTDSYFFRGVSTKQHWVKPSTTDYFQLLPSLLLIIFTQTFLPGKHLSKMVELAGEKLLALQAHNPAINTAFAVFKKVLKYIFIFINIDIYIYIYIHTYIYIYIYIYMYRDR